MTMTTTRIGDWVPETWEQKHLIDYLRQHPGAFYETAQAALKYGDQEFFRAYRRLRDFGLIRHCMDDLQYDLYLVEAPEKAQKARGMKHVTIDYRPGHEPATTTDKFHGW